MDDDHYDDDYDDDDDDDDEGSMTHLTSSLNPKPNRPVISMLLTNL